MHILVGINSLPEEILDQIIRGIPIVNLLNIMLASRAFWRQARPHLYKTIRYIDEPLPSSERDVVSVRYHARIFDDQYSARIVRLREFLRTITENPVLVSFIKQASFSWTGTGQRSEADLLRTCFTTINPGDFHVALPYRYSALARLSTVNSLDLIYPSEGALARLQHRLRDLIYSIFMIDTLRDLTLRCARSWHAFTPLRDTDKVRARTSSVVSLSLPDTVPMDEDLVEILTWPKALKVYDHDSLEGLNNFFQTSGNGPRASAGSFLQGEWTFGSHIENLSILA
ncbi:hypothetical protein BKA64DRAFT_175362 [Cadophora sp. MPI-SDFR-AT-0126]|nr:hypothetical protein BKA64DRAFT_175362 [Leotiomycetes sp. MPI-SDFR-AT-0126]